MDAPIPPIHPRTDADSRLLFRAALVMLIFTVFAFAQKVVAVPATAARYDAMVIAHAGSMVGWLALFTVQTGAVQVGAIGLHKRLGAVSPVLVAAALVTGFIVTRDYGAEFGVIHIFLGNMVHLGAFGGLYTIAVIAALRHRIDWHRRAMFLASFATLTPPISRVTQTLGLPDPVAAVIHMGLICTLPVAFDLAQRRRIHPATITGLVLIFGLLAAAIAFGTIPVLSDWTQRFVGVV